MNYTSLEPAIPSEEFSLIKKDAEGIFYIVTNFERDSPYIIEILDINGDIIQKSTKLQTESIVKFKKNNQQNSIRILEDDNVYRFELEEN